MNSVVDEVDIEKGLKTPTNLHQNINPLREPSSPSPSPSPSSATAPALVLSNSGKRMDQAGKKKYVKQVTGRHNDTELHLAAQRGDLVAVKQILDDIDSQMVGTVSGADFDAEVAEIRASVVNEVNELGETALYTAAEKGHLEVVKELLKDSNKETITRKSRMGFNTLHIAASEGHNAIVQLLLDHDPSLCLTTSQGNTTPLITAATRGHTAVVKMLLAKEGSLLNICRSNGKNALHLAAKSGHAEIVKALLEKDPFMARKADKKGQIALHVAAKGVSIEVVKLLLEADAAMIMLPDKSGFTALHVATRKKRAEIVNELLSLPGVSANVNALTRDHKTALDIAEGLPLSKESSNIISCLTQCGAVRANELNQPQGELRNERENKNISGIAKEVRKLRLAAKRGDLAAVKQILDDNDSQMVGTLCGADFDAEFRASLVNYANKLGETALFMAAGKGHFEVVKELLKYSNKVTITRKSRLGFDTLHIAASQGHDAIVRLLLDHDPSLCQTRSRGNATPLITAAARGHTAVVKELLAKDCSLLDISRSDGKNALHLAARSGHVEIIKALLEKDPLLARRTDKKGQTALHTAVKGFSSEVVKLLLEADAAIIMLPNKSGFTALHVATRKERVEMVNELLSFPGMNINVNALTIDQETALDIAEGLPLSVDTSYIIACLTQFGAVRANELNQPQDKRRNAVTEKSPGVVTSVSVAPCA